MIFLDFEDIISKPRMRRYLLSVKGDKRKAQTLYRKNLKLSQEFFTIISCFEVALRNKIDTHFCMEKSGCLILFLLEVDLMLIKHKELKILYGLQRID